MLRTHRKLGLATKLMMASRKSDIHVSICNASVWQASTAGPRHAAERAMVETFDATYVSLHVRATNYAAHHLYRDSLQVRRAGRQAARQASRVAGMPCARCLFPLQYKQHGVEAKYYADGEDGLDMRKVLSRESEWLPGGLAVRSATATQSNLVPPCAVVGLPPLPKPEAKWALPPGPTAAPAPKAPAPPALEAPAAAPPGGAPPDDAAAEIEPGAKVVADAVGAPPSTGSSGGGDAKKPKKKKNK